VILSWADQLEEKGRKNYVAIFGLQETRNEQYVDSMRTVTKVLKRNGTKNLGL